MNGYGFNPHTGELYSNTSYRFEQIKIEIEEMASACKKPDNDHIGYEFYVKFDSDNRYRFIRKYNNIENMNFIGSVYDLERCDFDDGIVYQTMPEYILKVRNKEYVKTQSIQSLFICPIFQSYERSIIIKLKSLFEELIKLTKYQ